MKSTKLLLLPGMLSYGVVAQAQQEPLSNKQAEVKTPKIEEALRGFANLRYIVMKRFTPVYYQVADTVGKRPARMVFPSTKVYIREYTAEGFWVDLGNAAGERYYLPAKSVKGLPVHVEI
ncbi:hypothetical protein [Hymenobacter cellulosivorans]|uniref:Uncharacterized protein n=1 Tax=Hymenobacter cellulosivorans TaxID=2932249 RepID=A0ABY4FCE3_9BACT|nr:hypothetical protein [Hymenobacter cellulosivorans]UOQ53624.1 hypothetical protein MUN80_02435 [Hymenobacter cellulosivorans]